MKAKGTEQRPKPRTLTLTLDGDAIWQRAESAIPRTVILKLLSAGQLLSKEIPSRRYLLKPWLRQEESLLLYAETGVGKSLFALSAAIAVAGGGGFLGYEAEESPYADGWRVLYVDGEMNEGDIQERLRGLLEGAAKIDRQKVLSNLSFISRQGQDNAPWFPSITDPEGEAFYRRVVEDSRSDLLILDNFTTLGEIEDENDAAAFNPLKQTLLGLKQQGVATVLVHHAKKDGQGYRGSSAMAATFEVILKLSPREVEFEGKTSSLIRPASFSTEFEKVRSGAKPPEVLAQLQNALGFEGGSVLRWEYETVSVRRLTSILEGLKAGQWRTQQAIAADFDVDPSTVSRWIRQGEQLGIWNKNQIKRWLKNGKGRPTLSETPEGADHSDDL
jgi:RecA-family ATPase